VQILLSAGIKTRAEATADLALAITPRPLATPNLHKRWDSAGRTIQTTLSAMTGLVASGQSEAFRRLDDVDDRDEPGHDGVGLLS
jgi:hypothetical protein